MQGGVVAYTEYSLNGEPQETKVPAFMIFSKKVTAIQLADGTSRTSRKRAGGHSAPAPTHFLGEVQTGTTYAVCTNKEFGAQAMGIELSAL